MGVERGVKFERCEKRFRYSKNINCKPTIPLAPPPSYSAQSGLALLVKIEFCQNLNRDFFRKGRSKPLQLDITVQSSSIMSETLDYSQVLPDVSMPTDFLGRGSLSKRRNDTAGILTVLILKLRKNGLSARLN